MFRRVYFLKNNLRKIFQPHFGGNKIHITKNIGRDLFFYDVNSMYPYMMLKRLPNRYCQTWRDCNLNMFFGFVYATLIKKPYNSFFS